MAFETNKFTIVKKKRLEKSQFNVECNVATEVEIDKILSVCHTANIENVEVLNGIVNFSANLDVCVLFCTIDGEIGTINSCCPFTSKFEDSAICVGDKISISIDVNDCQIEGVSSNNIKLNCNCTQTGLLILTREVGNVVCDDADMCIKEDEILVNTLVGEAKEVFSLESEVSIKEPIKKVLLCDSQVSVGSVESGVNFVSVAGEVVSRILYLTEKDRFESCYVTENFKEEIEIEGVTRDSISEATAFVKKNAVKCEIEELEKGIDVKLTIPVEIKVVSYQEKNECVIKDVYSVKHDLEISTESFEMASEICSDYFETKIDGNLSLDDDKPRVDKIMFVGGSNLSVTNSYLKNGEIFVEGVAKTNVVYLNDETNSLNSVVVEVPFVVSDKATASCQDVDVNASAILYDVDVVVKKGREFYFDAKIKVKADYHCEKIGAVISRIETASELPEKDCAIEVVFAFEGQSSWEIAKNLKVREETICLQNSDLVFPLEKDSTIVVYHQKR